MINPFDILARVQEEYRTYVQTFQQFQNPVIRAWVLERIQNGTLLWKPPYIQLSRPFAPGESFAALVAAGVLHPQTPPIFRREVGDPASAPVPLYQHQSAAIRRIAAGQNVVVATGTGSGKSFAFGIPIISAALRMREQGVRGIKAVIVYPMNALANSQYDDFAARLHGSGLRLARYTGDTASSPAEALSDYQRATGRQRPYDSEVLSREEIQNQPPDILMTNYVMLELLLTRFEDRKLFAAPGVLQFLVLDEVHTYTGKRGADVAALIRRLKQHTGAVGTLRCIGTSATVEATPIPGPSPNVGGRESEAAIADFAQQLFGEPFAAENVITETYAPLPESLPPLTRQVADLLAAGPQPLPYLAEQLDATPAAIQAALLQQPASSNQHPVPKLHAFFSQGRAIAACLQPGDPHLNDRGERVCPVCAEAGRADTPTFPLVFCRACGQELWSVAVDQAGQLHPAELDDVNVAGRVGYLLSGQPEIVLPDGWLTPTGKVKGGEHGFQDVAPEPYLACPDCGCLLPTGGGTQYALRSTHCLHSRAFPVTFLPAPFLLCPTCGIVHDRRSREYNKLFIFGSVGRSTATDVLVSAQVQALPAGANKVIAFSDNRQDTALQAAHINSLHRRFTFRQTLYTALREGGYGVGQAEGAELANLGGLLFDAQKRHHVAPEFRLSTREFGRDRQAESRYQQYLDFVTLWELGGTHRRTHQNLEDVGLLAVTYYGLDECAAADDFWADVPRLAALEADLRYDLLLGLLDLLRKRLALAHEAILEPTKFENDVVSKLNPRAYLHDELFKGPVGYSDEAEPGRYYRVFRLTGSNTQPVVWVKRVFAALGQPLDHADAVALVQQLVEKLGDPRAEFLVPYKVHDFQRRQHELWMVNPAVVQLQADVETEHWRCPKCGTVQHFRALRVCTGVTCRAALKRDDLAANYFRQVYATPLGEAAPIVAEEHSGQVSGQERREIELRFRSAEDPLNVLICTPTMELGIDIGHLNAVTLRNVPPSPSNYAQRAGRAGRSGQPALISVFAGVGAARGPHDQYFYRFPEKMIAGAIAAPRFRLDNQALIATHIHALVLETLGLKGAERLPGLPQELLDLTQPDFPLHADWRAAYERGIAAHFQTIVQAVETAFAAEMQRFAWLDRAFIEARLRNFLPALDAALARWRTEYQRLDTEREALNLQLGKVGVDFHLDRRRSVIERKLEQMREGQRDWYLYRYLGGEGFLPGYAFPPQAAVLALDDREDEMPRDPAIALSEYAPGNFVYYRGQRYEVTHARPTRRPTPGVEQPQTELDIEPVLICPSCQSVAVGTHEVKRPACACGAALSAVHPRWGMALPHGYAQSRARITADEEERLRLGYVITPHYRPGGQAQAFRVLAGGAPVFTLTLEHNGEVLLINQGQREPEGDPQGFTLCRKCYQWLVGKDAALKHLGTLKEKGECPRNARSPEDLVEGLWLTHLIRSDLALFDAPLPAEQDPHTFYPTLLHTLLRALLVAFNLDASELAGFLAAGEAGGPPRLIIYETASGGSGVLAALHEPGRLEQLLTRVRELLHEGDPEGGCERACYDCLLSFYNQRDHAALDRRAVLPWLQAWTPLAIEPAAAEDRYAALLAQCDSDLERAVLHALRERGLRLPDAAQHTLYDGAAPLAIADFYYNPKIVVFVDGSPHYRDYVEAADERKRKRLKALGYRVVVIRGEDLAGGVAELAERMG